MNYYRNNSLAHEEVDLSAPIIFHPWNQSYKEFTDKAHSSLDRCSECRLKFDLSMLTRIDVGILVCQMCLKGAA